jgi:hypothetical protein
VTVAELLLLAVDLALAVLVLEATLLVALQRMRGRGLSVATILLIAASGLGLLIALRGALMGASPFVILGGMSLGGLAHAIDLARRLRAR